MTARSRAGFALVLFLAALLLPGAVAAQQRKDLDALRSRIEKARSALHQAEENRGEAREELRESELAMSRSMRELRSLSQQREAVRAELQALEARRNAARGGLAARERQLAQLLVAAYRNGEAGPVRLLLSGGDANQTARELHYLAHVSRAHTETIGAARALLETLSDLEARSRAKTAELEALQKSHEAQHAELRRQQAGRRQVLDRLSARIRAQKQEVKTLERDEQRLARLVEELARVIAAVPRNDALPQAGATGTFASQRGRLRLPAKGVIANRFGSPRVEGGPSWKGVFIRAAAGEDVRAVASGRVVFSEWMRGLGNLLVVDHGHGYLTIYGNNESVYRSVGDEVHTGDVVASVGATGGTQESGLYFEIRHEGRAFDPMSWVTLR